MSYIYILLVLLELAAGAGGVLSYTDSAKLLFLDTLKVKRQGRWRRLVFPGNSAGIHGGSLLITL